jgi:hypothetical protein
MTSATIDKPHRSVLPLVNLLLSGAALTIGVVALTTNNASTADDPTSRSQAEEATRPDVAVWEMLPPGPVRDAMREYADRPPIGATDTRNDYCVNPPARGGPQPC